MTSTPTNGMIELRPPTSHCELCGSAQYEYEENSHGVHTLLCIEYRALRERADKLERIAAILILRLMDSDVAAKQARDILQGVPFKLSITKQGMTVETDD